MPLLRTTLSANPLGAHGRISRWDGRGTTAPQNCLSERITSGAGAGGPGARPPLLRLAAPGRNGRCCAASLLMDGGAVAGRGTAA